MKFILKFPDKIGYNGEVDTVALPLASGNVVIGDNHEPFLGLLSDGSLIAKKNNSDEILFSFEITKKCNGIVSIKDNITEVLIEN
ncbi:MAG: hypothetical protein OEY79_04140 [Anaplasmataceae bacterium]|nr:hypothetical protein [Anaplasmataceae bacterium]